MILDTHMFLWWLFDDVRLSVGLRTLLADPTQAVFVSSASVWEIATKHRLGKLPQAGEVAGDVPAWITRAGFAPLPISPQHAQLAGSWQHAHRDPFDRMLVAQARIEALPLATDDAVLASFGVDIVG
ncbi:type II toxin-antitoxin system VapC family toxin [Immundisolibacter sp.]|uniref:type II toxin-antitoxin system VapC family toxin n=1 Tax=Immundisolibacter sp. TaxID=1934948 RepID=UPI0035670452